MKIVPVTAPANTQTQQTSNNTDAKSRAINAFMQGQQPQTLPVQNASQVSPEEMSAIKATSTLDSLVLSEEQNLEAATPTEETIVEEVKTKVDPEVEKRFSELSRQERVLRARAQKQAQEHQAKEAALAAREAAFNEKAKMYDQGYIAKDRFKSDPLGVMAETEMSYDELTQQVINQQTRDPRVDAEIKALRDELKSMRAANEENKTQVSQKQQDDYKAAIKQISRDVEQLVKQDMSAYEAISKTRSERDVVELIEKTYQQDGIILSVEEAANEVENYLVEEGFKQVSQIDKIKKRLAQSSASTTPTTQVEQKTQAKPEQTQSSTMKTLTNAAASTRKLSARERALLAFKGELKN